MLKSDNLYKAIFKSMLGRYSVYAVNIFSMMILARMFTPEVFGIVAALMVFFIFFQLIAEAGLGPAIINLDCLLSEDRNGLFGLTITVGLVLSLGFAALAPVILLFYGIPRIDEIVPYIAISLMFFSACIIPNAILLREQAFFRIAYASLAAEILSTATTVSLVQFIDPLHALAAKGPVSAATIFIFTWYYSGKTEFGRPIMGRKFSAIKPLLKFSSYQFGFNFINYFSRNLDKILVGKYMGASVLGSYDKAYQLMRYPMLLLTFAMTPAIQPVIRKHSDNPKEVEAVHRDFTYKLSIVAAAAGLVMFVFADTIVLFMLGSQWLDVIPIIRILSIAIPVQVILSTSGGFFQAMNRADLLFLSGLLSAIIVISAIILGIVQRDIELMCWYLVAAFHINFLQAYYYMYRKTFNIPLSKFLVKMLPASSVIIGMVIWSWML